MECPGLALLSPVYYSIPGVFVVGLAVEVKVGKKYAIYLPKAVVEEVGLSEGDKVLIRVEDDKILLEPIRDPIKLALYGKKFASIKPEEIERISLEEQSKYS